MTARIMSFQWRSLKLRPWLLVPMALRLFLIVGVFFVAGFTFMIGREIYRFRGYNEAEAAQPVVWKLAERIIELNDRKHLLPASADEWLAQLSAEDGQLLRDCEFRWTPDLDPALTLKVNDRYGFQINAKGEPAWLAADKIPALVPR